MEEPAKSTGSAIDEAIGTVKRFVSEITGEEPTDKEVARALKRYFVLREICEHIEMAREDPDL